MKPVKMKTKRSRHTEEAGFTLLETAISMVLLAIAGLGIASCFFFAASNNSTARDRELSMAVAQQEMEKLRNVPFDHSSLSATSGQSILIRAGRRYAVQTTITNGNVVNGNVTSKSIQIRVTPWSDSSRWARNISTIFGSVTMVATRTAQTVGPNRR